MSSGNGRSAAKALPLLRAIILLPVMAIIVIPGIILYVTGTEDLVMAPEDPADMMPVVFGIVLIVLGFLMAFRTVSLFTCWGNGTPAPWDPPRRLVIRGIYRHVRNPMISSVIAILIGESLIAGSFPLLCWALIFILANMIYIPRFEEPGLEKRFGEPYRRYKENVPRWIPRIQPWEEEPEIDPRNADDA